MIKKLFFSSATMIALASAANAQFAGSTPVRIDGYEQEKGRTYEQVSGDQSRIRTNTRANKGTVQHSRMYNLAEHVSTITANTSMLTDQAYRNYPYMWFQPDMYSIYSGPVKDTVKLTSYGVVLHPWWSSWNDGIAYAPGEMTITNADAYLVDSVVAFGVYGRNPTKTNIVDTLRFAYSYGLGTGTNIPTYYYATLAARYGVDTLFSAALAYDAAKHTMMKPSGSSGPNIVYKDVLLRSTDTGRTSFGIATGMSIPANNLFGVTVTFHSGENYTPYSDTAFLSTTINPNNPYKYGMFRPRIFKESTSAFPTYQKRNYNSGQYRQLPESVTNPGNYSPMWSWSVNNSTPSSYQYPDVDIYITCNACKGLSVANTSAATIGKAYPNPATNSITLPLTMSTTAEVNIALTNMLGQIIETRSLGKLNGGQQVKPVFNTANLTAGIYLVTVEADNARTTTRISVSH